MACAIPWSAAAACFETATQLEPRQIGPMVNASLAYSNMGQNDRGTEYNDLELICRNVMNVDRFKSKGKKAGPKDERQARIDAARDWLKRGRHEAGARALVENDAEWEEVKRG